jgi:hypothetical protein
VAQSLKHCKFISAAIKYLKKDFTIHAARSSKNDFTTANIVHRGDVIRDKDGGIYIGTSLHTPAYAKAHK